jgi:NAD(P)-dependent dehydrogenase (short-subunit alcohol dehydrogenase family)
MSTVLVAGGATGIGRAAFGQLRARGHNVHIADVNLTGAEEVVAEWAHLPGKASASSCDLSSSAGPGQAVHDALQLTASLDAVVVCAAILIERVLGELTIEEWDTTMALNLRAPFLLTQAAGPALASSEHGRVVLIGSTAAFRGGGGSFAYAASKGAW